jgi:predicted transposase YbfD/YdcC
MQYIARSSTPSSTPQPPDATPAPIRTLTPRALLTIFATVPDPRRRQGLRFALSAILTLAVAAILSNHLSVLAMAEWGAAQRRDLAQSLGFSDGLTPHQSTLHRLFRKLNPDKLSAALTSYFALDPALPAERSRGSQGVAIDGKAQRGRLPFQSGGCPVHALSAFLHEHGIVLAHEPIDIDEHTDKAEAELTVAPALIARLDWRGRVLTGDALFCQRTLCQQVLDAGGDYLLIVKENQPTLLEDIRLLFDPPAGTPPLDDRREATTLDQGHGRQNDRRHLIASTDLVGYSDWPGLAQAFRLERTWQEHGASKGDVRYGITSLPPTVGDASRLLALKRGHWQIENRLHYVRDVTLDEDRSLVHVGHAPSVMALFRDLALNLLRQAGYRTIATRLRFHSCHPEEAVALLTGAHVQNA